MSHSFLLESHPNECRDGRRGAPALGLGRVAQAAFIRLRRWLAPLLGVGWFCCWLRAAGLGLALSRASCTSRASLLSPGVFRR